MPVVQDKYTIDVTNRFGISEDVVEDSGDEIENVDPFALINEMEAQAQEAKKQPKKKVQKKAAAPAAEKKEAPVDDKKVDKKRGPGGPKREGQRRDGQRPRGDRPPREPRQGGDVDGARENRPRRDRGDGERRPRRDGERRPRRDGDGGPRRFDRKSGDPRSSYKGSDKREGAGQGNWGTEKDELKGQTEAAEERPSEEKAEGEAPAEVAPPAPVEEEDKTLTLEEYMKQKKSIVKNSNARVMPSAETEQKEEFKREKKGRAARYESLDFNAVAFRPARRERDGDRDNRDRRGPRDNNRRGPRDNKKEEKKDSGFNLAGDDFPSL